MSTVAKSTSAPLLLGVNGSGSDIQIDVRHTDVDFRDKLVMQRGQSESRIERGALRHSETLIMLGDHDDEGSEHGDDGPADGFEYSLEGLTTEEADRRLHVFGPNRLPETIIPPWKIFLSLLIQVNIPPWKILLPLLRVLFFDQ